LLINSRLVEIPTKHYLWFNGESTNNISNLSAGSIQVTVTDAQKYTKTAINIITEPTAISVNSTLRSSK